MQYISKSFKMDVNGSSSISTQQQLTSNLKYRRKHRQTFLWQRIIFLTVIFCLFGVIFQLKKLGGSDVNSYYEIEHERISHRRLLEAQPGVDELDGWSMRNCTPSTIEEFPEDVFSNEQREKGAIVVHFCIVIYMFLALAIVCDDYFVSSLEKICERLGFSEDVAGATFMAAGSSAPELFTSIIGVFIAKGDVGVGTIVGSAVFNILVIIGLCAIFTGQVIPLTWWPMARDTFVYTLAVIALMLVIIDGKINWWESLILLMMYGGYIFLMWLNPKIFLRIEQRKNKRKAAKARDLCNNSKTAMQMEQVVPLNSPDEGTVNENGDAKKPVAMVDEYICNSPKRLTFSDAGLKVMLSKQFPARTRLRTACWLIITEKQMMEKDPEYGSYMKNTASGSKNGSVLTTENFKNSSSFMAIKDDDDVESGSHHLVLGQPEGLCSLPDSWFGKFRWLVTLPLCFVMFFTIPDCRRPRFYRWYLVTFSMSIVWIAVFSYIMVWMVALIGFTMHIPDTIIGIAFLAAGTSVPDAMASLIVARQGLGDMAVSNSIGSNVFDILLGLALPWFIKTAIVDTGDTVLINSRGLKYSVSLLLATVLSTIITIHCFDWKLTRNLGILLILFYFVFLTLCILVEFNMFGYVNPPMCAH